MAEKIPLTDSQNEELEALFYTISEHEDVLNEWEKGFFNDNYERWQKFGKNIYITEKQWAVLFKIRDKIENPSE
jgi:hypothetical protein